MSILERIRSWSPAAQFALAAGTALLIVAVLCAAWLMMRPRYEVLFRDLRPADAATIVSQLDKDKTPYKLDDGGATILARADTIDQTRLAIMGADLPLKGTVGFELFNKSDMGLTEFAQRINYQRALQGELARTIMTIEAIDSARVHLTLPEPSIFRADRKPAKASVTLTTRPGRALTPQAVSGIQRLVAAAVPDLEVGAVVVLDAQGAMVAGAPVAATGDVGSASVQQTQAIQDYYAARLRRALEPLYPGVTVRILVPADQWSVDGGAARDDALAQWSPNERAFRLQVEVSAPVPFSETQRNDVGRIVSEATNWSADRGDVLLFPVWTGDLTSNDAPVAAPPARLATQPAAPITTSKPMLDMSLLAWGVVTVAVLAGLVLLLGRRRRASATLTQEQRDAYIRRLQRLLAEGGHAG